MDEAEASLRRAIQIKPDYAEAHNNLGLAFQDLGRLDEAEAGLRRAIQIKPDYAEAYSNLGITLKALGRLDEAEVCYRRALQIKPNYADAHYNLGNTLHELSRLAEAEASYRRALQIKPDLAEAHSNLIFTLDLTVGADTASLQEERKRWNAAHATHCEEQRTHSNIPDPERRLCTGYVSPPISGSIQPRMFSGQC